MLAHGYHGVGVRDPREAERRVAAAGWGAFFIWIGIAFIVGIGFAWTMIGVGAITMLTQLARTSVHLPVERFWIVVGGLFAAAGVWDLVGLGIPLIPVLLIVLGTTIVVMSRRNGGATVTPEQ